MALSFGQKIQMKVTRPNIGHIRKSSFDDPSSPHNMQNPWTVIVVYSTSELDGGSCGS
jgi:hypothetical protein